MQFAEENIAGYTINGKNVCPACIKDSAQSDADITLHVHMITRKDVESAQEPICCDHCKKPL